MAILDRFSKLFETSDHQYGFKKHLRCRDAIFTVRQLTERYIFNGSTVGMRIHELSKGFNRTNHYALLLNYATQAPRHKGAKCSGVYLQRGQQQNVICIQYDTKACHFNVAH